MAWQLLSAIQQFSRFYFLFRKHTKVLDLDPPPISILHQDAVTPSLIQCTAELILASFLLSMSTASHALGHIGEEAALAYLLAQGYTVVHRNYRYQRAEVDLIMRLSEQLLVFVEVKARSSTRFGHPEEFVTARKQQLFRLAADQVQYELNWTGDIRFDILALITTKQGLHIEHFKDAFY